MNGISHRKEIVVYLTTTLALSYLYQGLIAIITTDHSSSQFTNMALILMYFPGIIALVCIKIFQEPFTTLGLRLKRPLFWIYGIVIPLIIVLLFLFLVVSLGVGKQSAFLIQDYNIGFLDKKPLPVFGFIPLFLLNFIITSVLAGLFSIGEELGWRGYLQNKMIKEFGLFPGILLLGTVWGYWHLPLILLGYNFPEFPILGGLILMPLTTIGFSFIFAWLTLRAQNIWPAVLAHGAINTLLSDSIIGRVEVKPKIILYLLLVTLWLIAGVIAAVKLRTDQQAGKLSTSFNS